MEKVLLYHNPRCSKSRKALEILRDHQIEPEIVLYLKNPPSADRLDSICRALGVAPLAIMRTKEPTFKELGLSTKDDRTRSEWLKIIAANPILLERPIAVHNRQVVIGRPPERVMEIL